MLTRASVVFKQADITRAVRGALAAGVEIACIKIDVHTGNIIITTPLVPGKLLDAYDAWKRSSDAH